MAASSPGTTTTFWTWRRKRRRNSNEHWAIQKDCFNHSLGTASTGLVLFPNVHFFGSVNRDDSWLVQSRINFSRICINSRLLQFQSEPDPLLLENTWSQRSCKEHIETGSLSLKLISLSFQWCGEQCWKYLNSCLRLQTELFRMTYLTIILRRRAGYDQVINKKNTSPDLGLEILTQISNYAKNRKRWRLEDKCFSTGLRQKSQATKIDKLYC